MKGVVVRIVILYLAVTAFSGVQAVANGGDPARVNIIDKGTARAVIVADETDGPVALAAAAALQQGLEQRRGAKVPIRPGGADPS